MGHICQKHGLGLGSLFGCLLGMVKLCIGAYFQDGYYYKYANYGSKLIDIVKEIIFVKSSGGIIQNDSLPLCVRYLCNALV